MSKIVFTGGSWDLFHIGHLNVLKESKKLGDTLIVGVSTDELIEKYKGVPPVMNFAQRSLIIQELRCVDIVVEQKNLFDTDQFVELNADLFVVGDDWMGKEHLVPGLKWLIDNKFLRYVKYTKGLSSSMIKDNIIKMSQQIQDAKSRRI
jgi:glycerol-3-phosphate cytidylyltransferase